VNTVDKDIYLQFLKALSPLSLPFLNQPEARAEGMSEAGILIVDDDENIKRALQAIREDEGYTVETAETAKKGIEKSEKAFHNFALIDFCLPEMEGIEFFPKLRGTKPKMRKISYWLPNAVERGLRREQRDVLRDETLRRVKILQTMQEQLKKQ